MSATADPGSAASSTPRAEDGAERSAADIRADYRTSFDELNRRLATTKLDRHVRFFNFGYVPLPGEVALGPTLSRAFPNPDSAQLLFQLIADADAELHDALVVEVGSGRGGNLGLLHDLVGARAGIGVDLTFASVAFASQAINSGGGFVQGDAEVLPIASGVADAALNIESAGCYPNIEQFFREVARILRPGGWFLYADLIHHGILPAYRRVLDQLGFALVTDRDITANVLASRERRADRERLALGEAGPDALAEWVGQGGSVLHGALGDGAWAYQILRLRRTDASPYAGEAPLFSAEEQATIHANSAFWADVLHLDASS